MDEFCFIRVLKELGLDVDIAKEEMATHTNPDGTPKSKEHIEWDKGVYHGYKMAMQTVETMIK